MTLDVVDKAMLSRWKDLFDNTHFVNSEPLGELEARNEIKREGPAVDQSEESVYPMLLLRRVGIPVVQRDNNLKAAHQGEPYPEEEQVKTFMRFLVRYQLDVLSTERKNYDELLVEIQESLVRYPFFVVDTGTREYGRHSFTLTLEDVQDLTEVESLAEKTPIYRAAVVYTTEVLIVRRYEHLRAESFALDILVKGDK